MRGYITTEHLTVRFVLKSHNLFLQITNKLSYILLHTYSQIKTRALRNKKVGDSFHLLKVTKGTVEASGHDISIKT